MIHILGFWGFGVLGLAAGAAAGLAQGAPRSVPAPELLGKAWLNATNANSLTWHARRGKVTIVHFWTFDCINCRHNLPFYDAWEQDYGPRGVAVIGIHTPETDAERDPVNVAKKVKALGLSYPVLVDAQHANWDRWQQRCWPTVYLVDKQGRVRYAWEGELDNQGAGGDAKMRKLIEDLIEEPAPGVPTRSRQP